MIVSSGSLTFTITWAALLFGVWQRSFLAGGFMLMFLLAILAIGDWLINTFVSEMFND